MKFEIGSKVTFIRNSVFFWGEVMNIEGDTLFIAVHGHSAMFQVPKPQAAFTRIET